MTEAMKQAILSGVRSALITVGSIFAAKGWIDDATVQAVVSAVVVVASAVWGAWDKFRAEDAAKVREVAAVAAKVES